MLLPFENFHSLQRFSDFLDKLSHLSKENKESITEFKRTCDSLQSCFDSVKCGHKEDEHRNVTEHMNTICTTVVYMYDDFGECMEKLEANNSTCFQQWTPLKKLHKSEEIDDEKLETLKKEMCTNIFGKEKCMKKEIIDECGEEKWNGAKKHFVALLKTSVPCELGELKM
uniref:DUF19 domain-containing protein n=1 Tax=Caenorhabditis japonica TaxID=281687 RepID=A0A8R1HI85_CAEJA